MVLNIRGVGWIEVIPLILGYLRFAWNLFKKILFEKSFFDVDKSLFEPFFETSFFNVDNSLFEPFLETSFFDVDNSFFEPFFEISFFDVDKSLFEPFLIGVDYGI